MHNEGTKFTMKEQKAGWKNRTNNGEKKT